MLQSSVSSESAPTTLSQRPLAPDDESKAKGWLSAEATASGAAGSKDTTSASGEAVGVSEIVQRLQDNYDQATDPDFRKQVERFQDDWYDDRKILTIGLRLSCFAFAYLPGDALTKRIGRQI